MADYLTISKQNPAFPSYLDFQTLRAIGIDRLQELSSELWTDYNLHDPGVTILEVLCYAVTDLGYRNNLDIQDLLALNPKESQSQDNNFFTPNQILTCNPVTELDWRKRLIDIPGVRNAWIEKVEETVDAKGQINKAIYEPAIYANCVIGKLELEKPNLPDRQAIRLNPGGLYDIWLDLDPTPRKDACGVVGRSWGDILDEVKAVLCRYRNLCEDFRNILVLGKEEIAVCADIELTANADPEDVLVDIFVAVQEFLAPRLTFYTLQELLAKGKSTAELFAGRPSATLKITGGDPEYPSHGFIDTDELKTLTLPTQIHTSDLYQIIMDVPGVAAIKKLSLINFINGLRQSEGHSWCLQLTEKHRPVLGVDQSTITFFKGDLPFKADETEVKQRYREQQAAYIKARKDPYELDLQVPRGTYYDLADHYSIHHDFPLTYGIGEDGLPNTVPAKRKAQAKQLKAYLIFFDQILANYLAQLSHVRDLFSWQSEADRASTDTQPDRRRTYFTQGLTNVPQADEILDNFYHCPGSDLCGESPLDYTAYLDHISEDTQTYETRRNRFLDHLLARFAETFTDYVLLNYRLDGGRRDESEIIDDKAQFIRDYPVLGRDRFRAFNYCHCRDIWDSNNVSGFKKRVARLLGIGDFSRRNLSHYRVEQAGEGIQLRLGNAQSPASDAPESGEQVQMESATDAGATSAAQVRFKSREIYSTDEAAEAAQSQLLRFALNPDHYKRLTYRFYYHYGWEVLDQDKAIATYITFVPNRADRQALLDNLVDTLQDREVPLQLAMISQLTRAIPATDPGIITVDEDELSLQITTPADTAEAEENQASLDEIAALLTALQTLFSEADIDQSIIDTVFSAPILLASLQAEAPESELRVIIPTADSSEAAEATPSVAWGKPILFQNDNNAPAQLLALSPDLNPQPIAPATAMLIVLRLDEAGNWRLNLTLPTTTQVDNPAETSPADRPLSLLRQRLIIALPTSDTVEAALSFPRIALCRDADDDRVSFELVVPVATDEVECLTFKSTQRYALASEAQTAAFTTLDRIHHRNAYRPIQKRQADGRPKVFTYYGYGIINGEGKLLAEGCDRFLSSEQRDRELQRWLTSLLANQNRFRVEQAIECFFVELKDRNGNEILLAGLEGVDRQDDAIAQHTVLLELGQEREAYELTEESVDETTVYSFVLRSEDRELAQHPQAYATERERDLRLDGLLYYLTQPQPLAHISGEAGTYQATLLDREGQPLLVTYHSYSTRNLAEAAYQRLLYLASDRVYYQILDDLEGEHPYGFSLVDRRGHTFATHPGSYPTACERDLVIQNVINYVNKDLTVQFTEQEEGIYTEILDREETTLLMGDIAYATEAEAQVAAEQLLLLARNEANYQRLDDGEADRPYSFALYDGETRLATHPTYYALESERNQALQALISCVLDENPAYEIDGVEGRFSYGLVDVLAETAEDSGETEGEESAEATEEESAEPTEAATAPLLLVSAVLYPDEEAARLAFDRLLSLGSEVAHYHHLDDLPAPNSYGFELRDEAGELVAHHQTEAGDAIGYSSEAERQAAIEKIIYYLAHPERQTVITNPEGAFFAEIYDDQGELVWSGQRTFPSQAEAEAEAASIRQWAQVGDRYHALDTGIGSCPYSFYLTDEAGTMVARHPRFYGSETERDQQIEQLRLSLKDHSTLVETPPTTENPDQFTFELPSDYFYAFHPCNADQKTRFESGSILNSPPGKTFNSVEEAQLDFGTALSHAVEFDNFVELYDNAAWANDSNAQPFSFELKNPADKSLVAVSPRRYRDRAEMHTVMKFIQQLAQGFSFTTQTPGTHCGYYFFLDLPLSEGTSDRLRSLQRYPTETRAWQAAGAFAENVRYLSRYASPAEAADGTTYGFGITDEMGILIAATETELDPLEVFQSLNNLESHLRIIPAEGEEIGYRFQLVETGNGEAEDRVWLQGVTLQPDEAAARAQFYRDVLGRLFEPDAIAPHDTPEGFSFRVILPASAPEAPPEILAIHPRPDDPDAYRFYPTAAKRDEAMLELRQFIRTSGITVEKQQIEQPLVGKILGTDNSVLLQGIQRFTEESAAWQHGNTLVELAQDPDNIRLIDDEDSNCLFSWELTNASKDTVLGLPTEQYASHEKRNDALEDLRDRLKDEGFHVLEHILLRPRQVLPPPEPCDPEAVSPDSEAVSYPCEATPEPPSHNPGLLPISLKSADCEPPNTPCRTNYDPYSFWVSIVLPYWPERFRDMNFRRFVERTLRMEAPAHIALKICWIDVCQMHQFDQAYRHWIEQFSLEACEGTACDLSGSLNQLIDIMSRLKNVYPEGTLHDCEESSPEDNPIILDQTALGTANS